MNYTSLSTTSVDTSLPQELISNGKEFQTWRRTQVLHLAPVIVLDVLVMLFGVVGNSVVCYVCLFRMQRTVINCFVLSLAATELMGCIFIIPVDITQLINSYAFDSPILCKIEKYFRKIVIFSTGCILVCIALERYKRIVKPHGRHVTLAQFRTAMIVSLMLSVILAVPEAVLAGSETIQTPYGVGVVCSVYHSDQYRNTIFPKIWGGVVVFLYVFSIAAIGITYFVIASKIWRRGKVKTDRISRSNTPDSTLQRRVKRFPNRTEENGFMTGSTLNSIGYLQSFQRSLSDPSSSQTSSTPNGSIKCGHPRRQTVQIASTDNKPNQYYHIDIQRNNDSRTDTRYNHNNNNQHHQCCTVNTNDHFMMVTSHVHQSDESTKSSSENDDKNEEDDCTSHLLHKNDDSDSNITEVESHKNRELQNKDIALRADEQHDLPTIKGDDGYFHVNNEDTYHGLPTIREDDKYFQLSDEKVPQTVDLNITSKEANCLPDEDSGFPSNSENHDSEDHDLQLRHPTMDSQRNRDQENGPTVFFSELIKSLSMSRRESISYGRKRYSHDENNCGTLHRLHSSLTPMGSFRRKSTYSRKRSTFIMFVMTLTSAVSLLPHISVMLYSLTRPGVEARLSPEVSIIFRIAWNSFFVSLASHPYVYGFWNDRFKLALYGVLLGFRRLRHRADGESLSSARHS